MTPSALLFNTIHQGSKFKVGETLKSPCIHVHYLTVIGTPDDLVATKMFKVSIYCGGSAFNIRFTLCSGTPDLFWVILVMQGTPPPPKKKIIE